MTIDAPDVLAIWAEARGSHGDFVMGDTTSKTGLPWGRNAEDMLHFREQTAGRILIMGRKTYETLPDIMKTVESTHERPLIVLTTDYRQIGKIVDETPGAFVQPLINIETAIEAAEAIFPSKDIAIVGGKRVIETLAPDCSRLIISTIPGHFPTADVLAPSSDAFVGFERVWTFQLPTEDKAALAPRVLVNHYTKVAS